jgi:hypothetical protein
MPHPFDSSRRKLDRARAHFLNLQGKVATFINSDPYQEVVDPHPDKPDHEIHKIKPTRESGGGVDDIGDDFGEFAFNLRSALDNAGYSIARASGKPNSKNCNFPFSGSLDEWNTGRCADLPREIQSLFFGFQPYFGGDDLLCAINAACNTDKHRSVVPAVNTVMREHASFIGTRFFEMPLKHAWDYAKNEMVLITLGPGSPSDIKYTFHFTAFVALGDIRGVAGQEILGVANAMGCKVESILMAVEAQCRRLKIIA